MCRPSYTPEDAAIATGLDLSHIENAMRAGDLEARVIGFQVVITSRALKKWLHAQPLLVLAEIV